jgi:hypothetical protein
VGDLHRGIEVASTEGLVGTTQLLNVLLRHRSCSISPDSPRRQGGHGRPLVPCDHPG